MANHDWVDSRIAGLAPDREWIPDGEGVFVRLRARRRANTVAVRRWMWTSVAATAVYMTLFLFPASRACAEQPGPCVLRAIGKAPVTLEIDPEFRAVFERDVLPGIAERYVLPGRVRLIYRAQPEGAPIMVSCKGKREVMAGVPALKKELEACL